MKTIVFLGPTLDITQARKILPNAWYHDPVQCGDILKVLRLKPDRMLIIDGYYENKASVWHKEIMYALQSGVEVYGAASMGALRAAELYQFGMQGIGEIFTAFASNELQDDDEVAVVHTLAQTKFTAMNDAMVNIRATVKKAQQEQVLNDEEANRIIDVAKKLPFAKRKLMGIAKELHTYQISDSLQFYDWLQAGNMVDIKKSDAVAALQHLRDAKKSQQKSTQTLQTQPTRYIRLLSRQASITTFAKRYDFLPDAEKILIDFSNGDKPIFALTQGLAALLLTVYELAVEADLSKIPTPSVAVQKIIANLNKDFELSFIYRWLIKELSTVIAFEKKYLKFKRWAQLVFGLVGVNLSLESLSGVNNLVEHYALIWLALDNYTHRLDIRLARQDVEERSQVLLYQLKIKDKQEIDQYCKKYRIKKSVFNELIMAFAFLRILYLESNYIFMLRNPQIILINWFDKIRDFIL